MNPLRPSEQERRSRTMETLKKPKVVKIGPIKKKAWTIFSRYVRLRASDQNGLACCFTCEIWSPWEFLEGGHFIPGRGNRVLYDERQVHPQCHHCNCTLHGNWPVYLVKMTDLHGPKIVSEMILTAKVSLQMKAYEHQEIHDRYQKKFEDLLNSR